MKVLLTATVQSHICQFHKPLVEVLREHDCEIHVAARNNLAEKNGLKLDFVDKVYDLPFSRSPKSLDNIKVYKQLKKIISEEHYDVIHCNTPMGGIVTRLASRKASKNGTRVIYTAHGFHFYKGAPKKNWIVFYPIEKLFSRFTDTLIAITNEDFELASKKFHCDVRRIHGVGVDERRYCPVSIEEKNDLRSELGFAPEQKIILNIGELLPNKNQKMAIHMMKEVIKYNPDSMLLIAGNGPRKEELESEIHNCGLDNNVKMLGYCTNLEKYQRISDVLVACSKREGLPLNVVEAMMTGNPVVATVNRGHRELVKDGHNGFLVNNENEMADRVISLLSNSDYSRELGSNAITYSKDYSFVCVEDELKGIYCLK